MKYLAKAKPKRRNQKPRPASRWTRTQRDLAYAVRVERMAEARDEALTDLIQTVVAETLVDLGVARFRDKKPSAEPPRSLN